ncbi:hypothetical protein C8R45DRAFT_1113107 [Mycena sanguinolenta]|nr:hypothetical protein C8R45DRAFT_1113107 [Mycena sanguinolenta]
MSVPQEQSDALARVEGLWFPTDAIVIRAENKIFRVTGGILAARSTVFRDMIAFPQPDGDVEKIDGLPVVRLHDSAEDVEVFLRAIFDSSYFMPAPALFPLFPTLGILRLSHKYDVPFLHRRALEHLAKDGWYRRTYDDPDIIDHLTCADEDSLKINFSIIAAALEVNAPWLLPWPYYCAATHSADRLLRFMEGQTAPYALKALAVHARLVRATIEIEGSLTTRDSLCANAERCDRARDSALARLFRHVSQTLVDPLPSRTDFERRILPKLTTDGRCSKCIQSLRAKHHEAACEFWDELPSVFGLQPWEDLHAMANAAMKDDPAAGMSH